MSIAVFDSGVGGISVLKSLVEVMPNEDFIYYGDSANAPYGTKTLEQVRALTCEHAKELILNQHAKGLVVACNTATSAAVRILREQYPDVPIVGIEPAVKPAMLFMENPRVLVMATPMTIREEKLKKLMDRYRHLGEIIPLPCPGLMNFVERGDVYGKPAIVTDTHCIRLCNRIGLVDGIKDPKKVEMELWKIIPPEESNDFCHRLVDHGRAVCTARTTPHCDMCVLNDICGSVVHN